MKHQSNPNRHRNGAPDLVPISFEYVNPTAKTVFVAGSFNDWKPEAKVMHTSKQGHWVRDTALAPGTYEYCLVVDGRWITDPRAAESVENPFGGRNSILTVSRTPSGDAAATRTQ